MHHITQKNWLHIYRRSCCPIFFALNLTHSYTDHVLAAAGSTYGLSSSLINGNYSDKSRIQTLPKGDTESIYLHFLTQARIRKNMIPWTYTRINNLGYKCKSHPSLPLICPVSCLAAIFQAETRILDMEHCWDCRKNVNRCQVINCCSGPVWHIILLQGQTRNLWISHGGFYEATESASLKQAAPRDIKRSKLSRREL